MTQLWERAAFPGGGRGGSKKTQRDDNRLGGPDRTTAGTSTQAFRTLRRYFLRSGWQRRNRQKESLFSVLNARSEHVIQCANHNSPSGLGLMNEGLLFSCRFWQSSG